MTDRPIGVFDSGVGGLSVLRALRAQLPHEQFVYLADTAHAPYGEKGDPFVAKRSTAITQRLLDEHQAKALVVACNTATAAAIHLLRTEHPQLPLVGVEPALKPAAALTRTGRVGVMATRGTLASAKFKALRESLAGGAEFVLQPCDGLADAIEQDDAPRVATLCKEYTGAMGHGIDVLVLGCTHYPFAEDMLRECVGPSVRIIETGEPVARQTRALLEAAGLLRTEGEGSLELLSTGDVQPLRDAAARWL